MDFFGWDKEKLNSLQRLFIPYSWLFIYLKSDLAAEITGTSNHSW
jgi:hypothetical protein